MTGARWSTASPTNQFGQTFWLPADLEGLTDAVTRIAKTARPDGLLLPANVIVGYADGQATIFERKGQGGPVRLRLTISGAEATGTLVDEAGTVRFTGTGAELMRNGVLVPLQPWECKVLWWRG